NGYNNNGYNSNGYNSNAYRNGGSTAGRTVATVIGGVLGAALGSQVGGGSARYATAAVGSMVGGLAGQQVYESNQRARYPRTAAVTVCDPVPVNDYPNGYSDYRTDDRGVSAYDVTYEYGGRRYTTRTNYHPGDRIRVRVDVRPE
ncbi:MAG: glycine zipper 2TM domain-containing protein, partial [Luteimonas sp.]